MPNSRSTPDVSPSALRIVHYLPAIRLEHGGIVRAVIDWCDVLAKRGNRLTLLTCDAADIPKEWQAGAERVPEVVVLPQLANGGRSLDAAALEHARARIGDADVLHLHAPWTEGNRQLAKVAMQSRVPYVVSVHGMLDDWSMSQRTLKKRIYLTLFGRRFLDGAACIHCTAEAEWNQASKWFSNRHRVVLPCLVNLTPFEQLPGSEMARGIVPPAMIDMAKILFLGRLHEKKGVEILIRAMEGLRSRGNSCCLLIAGSGEAVHEQHLRDVVRQLKLEERVQFLGLVTGTTKISLLEFADVFVLPTHQENFGLGLIEAMAAGTAVVTTRGTDIWEEIQRAGATISDLTADAIAGALSDLLKDPGMLRERGERGRKWAFEALAEEALAGRYEDFYRGLKTGTGHPSAGGAEAS